MELSGGIPISDEGVGKGGLVEGGFRISGEGESARESAVTQVNVEGVPGCVCVCVCVCVSVCMRVVHVCVPVCVYV